MAFVQDALFSGERFRVLNVVDNFIGPPSRKVCYGLLLGKSLQGVDVVTELSRICLVEGCFPERIQYDNGSKFISKEMDLWAYSNGVTLDFTRPGKPSR
jgi:putative transposase